MKIFFHRLSGLLIGLSSLLWPALSWAQEASATLENPLGTGVYFPEIWARLAAGLIFVTGALTLAVVVLGGYRILTAAGNAENFEKGKKMIIYAFLGMFVALGSYAILSITINVVTGGAKPFAAAGGLVDPLGLASDPKAGFTFYGGRLIRYALSSLGAITLLMAIYAGFTWLTSAGNEEKITTAKKTLSYAGIGLIIILTSYTFVSFIYTPLYKMLRVDEPTYKTGASETPQVKPETPVPCFRRDVGKDYGAICEPETVSDCNKPKPGTPGKQKGEAYTKYKTCDEIGACFQLPPGSSYRNRVEAAKCPEDNNGRKTFKAIATAFKDGTCNHITGTEAINVGTEEQKDIKCFADVGFKAGRDLPQNNDWACIRQFPNGTSKCDPQPAKTIRDNDKKVITPGCDLKIDQAGNYKALPTEKPSVDAVSGTFYDFTYCTDVGYCKQDGGKYQSCKNGIKKELCTPTLFSPVGMPVNSLWGLTCRPYEIINEKCYVGKVDFVAGKTCVAATNYNGACLKSYRFKGLLEESWVDNCFEDKNYKDCETTSEPALNVPGPDEFNRSFSAEKTCLQAGYTGACVDAANSCANNVVETRCLTSEGKIWSQGKTCSELGY
jgi:hypothetical protein